MKPESGGLVVVLGQPVNIEPIVDRFKNLQHLGQQFLVHRLLCPIGPLGDALRIGRPADTGCKVGIANRKLQRQLSDIDAATGAMIGSPLHYLADFRRCSMPLRQRRVGRNRFTIHTVTQRARRRDFG